MIKRIMIGVHIIFLVFALMIAIFNKLGCYDYIYTLSLWQTVNHSFDTIIIMFFFTIGVSILDLITIIIYIVKKIIVIGKKRNYIIVKKVIMWGVMLFIALLSMYIYLSNYIITMT